VSTFAGSAYRVGACEDSDGSQSVAVICKGQSIAFDEVGNLYVTQSQRETIRKIDTSGVVSTFSGQPNIRGFADSSSGSGALYQDPTNIVFNAFLKGLLVFDTENLIVRQVSLSGGVSSFAGTLKISGTADGPLGAGQLHTNSAISNADSAGNIYVADVQLIRKIDPTGNISTLAGSWNTSPNKQAIYDTSLQNARFVNLLAVGVSLSGQIFVVDNNALLVVDLSAKTVNLVAGSSLQSGLIDGQGAEARFNQPTGLAFDQAGNLYIADTQNNAIRKMTGQFLVTTLAGNGTAGLQDGGLLTSEFNTPCGLVFDPTGNLYVADQNNNRIRMISNVGSPQN
jgi:sugar lactone lactonase YvrE